MRRRAGWAKVGAGACVALGLVALASRADGGVEQDLEKALAARDRARIEAALAQVRGALTPAAVKVLVDGAGHAQQAGVILDLVEVLGTATGPAAAELGRAYEKAKSSGTRFLVLDALRGVQDPVADETLAKAAKKDDDPAIAVHAVRLLRQRGTTGALDGLVDVLEAAEKAKGRALVAIEAGDALRALLGQDHATVEDWRKGWLAVRDAWKGPPPAAPAGAGADDEGGGRRGRGGRRGGRGEADGGAGAAGAGGGGTRTVLDRMGGSRGNDLTTLRRLEKDTIVALKGDYDQVEDVLRALGIPCEVVERGTIETMQLHPERQILIANCHAEPLTEGQAQRLRAFVAAGGYLFTSDWELGNVLVRVFPDVVKSGGRHASEHVVTIQPCGSSAAHPLLRDVLPLSPLERAAKPLTWKVDEMSEFVLDHPAIAVLVEGPELQARYKTAAVAVTFGFQADGGRGRPVSGGFVVNTGRAEAGGAGTRAGGRGGRGGAESARPTGRVLHVISHFHSQADESGDGFALQQLLLNFVLEKQAARR